MGIWGVRLDPTFREASGSGGSRSRRLQDRRLQEAPRGSRRPQENTEGSSPGSSRRLQEAPGEYRRLQAPGSSGHPKKPSGGSRRPPGGSQRNSES